MKQTYQSPSLTIPKFPVAQKAHKHDFSPMHLSVEEPEHEPVASRPEH